MTYRSVASPDDGKLVRTIGLGGLILMCINAVVGSGVFLLPAESFRLLGPFSLWAPLLFSIPVFILVLCFAEAASHFSQPGGAYLYSGTAFGSFIGFETGWMNWIARITSLAALSNGLVVSLARIFPGANGATARTIIIVASLASLAIIHMMGVKYGAATIYLFTLGKLVPLIAFTVIAIAVFRTNPVPQSFTLPGPDTDWSEAALLLLFAYAGFENLGVAAGEYKNPRRDLPKALLLGILAIALMYSASQLAAMSALPDLSTTRTPIADAAAALMGEPGALFITIGALLSMMGTNSGTMLEGSRMLYVLAKDRRPYTTLGQVHEKLRTPVTAIMIHAGIAMAVALGGSFAKLAALSAVARMTTYLFTCAAVPRLRKLSPGFVSPGGLTVPVLGTLISIVLFATLKQKHLIAAALALTLGALLYAISTRFVQAEPSIESPMGDEEIERVIPG